MHFTGSMMSLIHEKSCRLSLSFLMIDRVTFSTTHLHCNPYLADLTPSTRLCVPTDYSRRSAYGPSWQAQRRDDDMFFLMPPPTDREGKGLFLGWVGLERGPFWMASTHSPCHSSVGGNPGPTRKEKKKTIKGSKRCHLNRTNQPEKVGRLETKSQEAYDRA